jgi:urease accessory protein
VAAAVAAYQLCAAFAAAAVRLGIVGHVDAQRILTALRPQIARVLETPAPTVDEIGAFTPAADIAMMRHEVATVRLFSN